MIDRPGKCFVLAFTALTLVSVVSVESALAKKNKVIATVDGKRYKWKGRFVVASFSGAGTIIVATKPARTLRTFGFGCPIYPPNETFPLTPPAEFCNANYTEARYTGGVFTRSWLSPQSANVTYDSFDGTRIRGSFSVTLQPVQGATEPVTIEGTFDTAISGG